MAIVTQDLIDDEFDDWKSEKTPGPRRKKQKLMAGVLQGLEALAISNRHISFYAIPNSRRPGVRDFKILIMAVRSELGPCDFRPA